ncbi:MAG: alpha/beta hydrolase [Mycobacterium sp.]
MIGTIPVVAASNPATLSDAAAQLQGKIAGLDSVIATHARTLTELASGWEGTASAAAVANAEKTLQKMTALREQLQTIRTTLSIGGANLAPLRQAVVDASFQAVALGATVGADGTVTPIGAGGLMTPELADAYSAVLKTLLHQFEAIDQATADAVERATPLDAKTGAPEGELPVAPPPKPDIEDLKPPEAATDTEINQWWDELRPDEQQRLIAERPEWIGNLDGVPGTARDLANRNRLETLRRETNLTAEERGTIAAIDEALQEPDRQLLVADFDGEHPKVALALGNVDTADHVSVYVPGTGSVPYDKPRAGNDLPAAVERAGWLKTETERVLTDADTPNETVATVAWLGYEPPSNLAQAGSAHYADDNAPELASFINGIDSSRDTDPHLTVLGHSYGSTLASEALQRGTAADDVVFMGSPGLQTNPLQFFDDVAPSDLHLAEGNVYIQHAKNDVVADLGRYGAVVPSTLPGFTDLSTNAEATPLGPRNESTGHSEYSFVDTTALYNQAVVVAGLGQDDRYVKVED